MAALQDAERLADPLAGLGDLGVLDLGQPQRGRQVDRDTRRAPGGRPGARRRAESKGRSRSATVATWSSRRPAAVVRFPAHQAGDQRRGQGSPDAAGACRRESGRDRVHRRRHGPVGPAADAPRRAGRGQKLSETQPAQASREQHGGPARPAFAIRGVTSCRVDRMACLANVIARFDLALDRPRTD